MNWEHIAQLLGSFTLGGVATLGAIMVGRWHARRVGWRRLAAGRRLFQASNESEDDFRTRVARNMCGLDGDDNEIDGEVRG